MPAFRILLTEPPQVGPQLARTKIVGAESRAIFSPFEEPSPPHIRLSALTSIRAKEPYPAVTVIFISLNCYSAGVGEAIDICKFVLDREQHVPAPLRAHDLVDFAASNVTPHKCPVPVLFQQIITERDVFRRVRCPP